MTQQLQMFKPKEMAPLPTTDDNPPSDLAEEIKGVAKRVRKRLKSLNAHHIEIGRDLQAVKDLLGHGQFLSWVTSACGLSRRTARLLTREADRALAALSTAQKGLPSPSMQGQRLDPRVVKGMVRAAKAQTPTPTRENGQPDDAAQLIVARRRRS